MASNGSIEGAESPFLLEALQSPGAAVDEELRWSRMRPLAAAMTPSARRHLERALVRDAIDRGVRDKRRLAEVVASVRRSMDPRARSEATQEREIDVAEAEVVTPFLTEELEAVRETNGRSPSARLRPPRPPRLDPSALGGELEDQDEFGDSDSDALVAEAEAEAEAEDDELDDELYEAAWPGDDESPFAEGEAGSPLETLSPSELKAVRITSTFETGRAGSFGGLTGNFDGQGVSFGLMNFAWKAGSLLTLLKDFLANHPTDFAEVFGSDAARFREIVLASRPDAKHPKRRVRDVERQMDFARTVLNDEGNKIRQPWRSYFGKLEKNEAFRRIQVKAVRKAAERARYWCEYFALRTERGYAFMFDLVSSHGGAWLNAPKYKGRRRKLLRAMLDKKKEQVGRDLTELEKLEVIANMIADVSLEKWRKKVRIRKLWFVRGTGKVHGSHHDLAKDFGVTDDPPDFGAGGGKAANELVDGPSFEFPEELEQEEEYRAEYADEAWDEAEDDEHEGEDVEGQLEDELDDDGELEDDDELEEGEYEEAEDDEGELEQDDELEQHDEELEAADASFGEAESDDEALAIDEEIEAEAAVAWEAETAGTMLPAETVDPQAAEPAFSATLRGTITTPLLGPAKAKKAVSWNAARHPGLSGIALDVLRKRIGVYVDLTKVKQAMDADGGYSTGDATLTAVAAHQFQRRIYAQKSMQDGMIGEGTLDALGFVRHRGAKLNPWDKENKTAKAHLAKVEKKHPGLFASLGSDVTAGTWFKLMVSAPFLGQPFNKGIHIELLRRLRKGQAHLMSLPAYKDMSPADIGRKLDIVETHKGARPTATTKSMHTFGLATDISYLKNPWVGGRSNAPNANAKFLAVTGRASLLIDGKKAPLTPKFLHGLGADSALGTGDIWDKLQTRNEQLKGYLLLETDASALRAHLTARKNAKTEGVFEAGESLDAAVTRWTKRIRSDKEDIRSAFGGSKRNPMMGFLNLARDLVVSLRDRGCLAWGAVDLGPRANGDMMHFDCRPSGIGRLVRPDPAHAITSGHPCVGATAAAEEVGFEAQLASAPTWKRHAVPAGALYGYKSGAASATTAVFIPSAVSPTSTSVDVLVYLHGLLVCGGEGSTAVSYVKSSGFPLAQQLESSGRGVVLVVPSLRWTRGQGWHRLGTPARMNALVDEVLAGLTQAGWSAPPTIGRLYLAGHSKAFVVLDSLGRKVNDAASSQTALGKLCEVWSFDTMYGKNSGACKAWLGWALARPKVKFTVYYRPNTKTAPASECLENAIQTRAGAAPAKRGCGCTSSIAGAVQNVTVHRHSGRHCPMVKVEFPRRLAAMSNCSS